MAEAGYTGVGGLFSLKLQQREMPYQQGIYLPPVGCAWPEPTPLSENKTRCGRWPIFPPAKK